MLQVYDRVLPGHSIATLQALVVIIVALYAVSGMLEYVRARLFTRLGAYFNQSIRRAVFGRNVQTGLGHGGAMAPSPFADLDQIRNFLSSGGPAALFDLPWVPLYIALLFLVHPYLGIAGMIGGLVLVGLTYTMNRQTALLQLDAAEQSAEANYWSSACRQSAETIASLGMTKPLRTRWEEKNEATGITIIRNGDVSAFYGALSKFSRMTLQSLVLAIGAYLVLDGKATGGVMIASSIVLGRALAPIEQAIGHWKPFVAARQSYGRLNPAGDEDRNDYLQLPPPTRTLSVENVTIIAPGGRDVLLQNVGFELRAGDALAVLGPSGSGKSSLARTIVGAWSNARGEIRFDGAAQRQWRRDVIAGFIGYLPQSVELFSGTIAENIARFDAEATSEKILKAAQHAGVDKLIKSFPEGFNTHVGTSGHKLSAGQRQRIALARALYGDPFVVVLDEPNSSLDSEGESALLQSIESIRRRDGIVIVVAHRTAILQVTNKILHVEQGRQVAFELKEHMFQRAQEHAIRQKAAAQ